MGDLSVSCGSWGGRLPKKSCAAVSWLPTAHSLPESLRVRVHACVYLHTRAPMAGCGASPAGCSSSAVRCPARMCSVAWLWQPQTRGASCTTAAEAAVETLAVP